MNNKFLKLLLFSFIVFSIKTPYINAVDSTTKEFVKKYPIAAGKPSTPSPIGQWQIISKAKKNGPFGGFWLGLNAPWDTFGIHGTSDPSSIGSLASGGCIRMFNENIEADIPGDSTIDEKLLNSLGLYKME
mgnify:CR=1 FL=1